MTKNIINAPEHIVLNAMILWEAFLEEPENYPALNAYRDAQGSVSMREAIAAHAQNIENAWQLVQKHTEYENAFDFEFAPLFLKTCLNDNLSLNNEWYVLIIKAAREEWQREEAQAKRQLANQNKKPLYEGNGRFEVRTDTLCQGWISCWTVTDAYNVERLQDFATINAAQAEIDEHIEDCINEEVEEPSPDDFRIYNKETGEAVG